MARRIAIVGGGVIGVSIAWHLARLGAFDVTLLERDRLGSGTTWHSAGNITWKPSRDRDQAIMYAFETVATLEAEGEQPTGWLKTGRLFLAETAETIAGYQALHREAEARGIPARWIEPAEAVRLNPLIDPTAVKGIWLNPLSGRLNPSDLTSAYAAGARKAGARIVENCNVLGLTTRGDRVTGVVTAAGTVDADVVVVAAGLWSRALLAPLGLALGQWPVEHFYLIADVTPRLPRDMPSFVSPDHLIYGREEVGGLLVGFFDENARTIDPAQLPEPFTFTLLEPDYDKIAPYFASAIRIFPALAEAPVRRFINGPETFTPDGLPLIGRPADVEGLLVATALNSAGVTWSAMAGDVVTRMIDGRPQRFETAPFDPGRFGAQAADLDWLKAKVSASVSGGYRSHNK